MPRSHWAQQSEHASNLGISFLIVVLRLTGPNFVKVLTIPVALYYYLVSNHARQYSRDYLLRLRRAG